MKATIEEQNTHLGRDFCGRIFERDGLACANCHMKRCRLFVYKFYEEKGRSLWDYPEDCVTTLCQNCSDEQDELLKLMSIGRFDNSSPWNLAITFIQSVPDERAASELLTALILLQIGQRNFYGQYGFDRARKYPNAKTFHDYL